MDCEQIILLGVITIIGIVVYNKMCEGNNYVHRYPPSGPPGYRENFSINAGPSTGPKLPGGSPAPPVGDRPKVSNDLNDNTNIFASEEIGNNETNPTIKLSRGTSGCVPQTKLSAEDLLPPEDKVTDFNKDNPVGVGDFANSQLLDAKYTIGIDTIGQSMKNANRQLRSEPPNPQKAVSPWMNTTISPDLLRKPLEFNPQCS